MWYLLILCWFSTRENLTFVLGGSGALTGGRELFTRENIAINGDLSTPILGHYQELGL
jgi:hypothetical protein